MGDTSAFDVDDEGLDQPPRGHDLEVLASEGDILAARAVSGRTANS
ncbi:MAG: hypothetical protein ACXWN2_11255 [Candidatus Limnocylindrales bacterium]